VIACLEDPVVIEKILSKGDYPNGSGRVAVELRACEKSPHGCGDYFTSSEGRNWLEMEAKPGKIQVKEAQFSTVLQCPRSPHCALPFISAPPRSAASSKSN
jgi:hypothetical protein